MLTTLYISLEGTASLPAGLTDDIIDIVSHLSFGLHRTVIQSAPIFLASISEGEFVVKGAVISAVGGIGRVGPPSLG